MTALKRLEVRGDVAVGDAGFVREIRSAVEATQSNAKRKLRCLDSCCSMAIVSCPKRIVWVQGSTHGYVPPKPQKVTW